MAEKNTIVIESNPYKKEIKYFWKNDDGTLSDLAETTNSPFSDSKPQYKEFSKAVLVEDIANMVIQTINETYNKQNGLCIEINGVKEDYKTIKNAIEKDFPDRHMECKWNKHVKSSTEVTQNIKKIYHDLMKALSKYDDKGIIKLCDEDDGRKWLRSGFNWENVTSELDLYSLCGLTDGYLDKLMAEIEEEKLKRFNVVDELEQELDKEKKIALEIERMTADKKLAEIVNKMYKEKRQEFSKQFEDMLNSCKEKILDENRIANRIKTAVEYADEQQNEWTQFSHENEFIASLLNAHNRTKFIRKMLVEYLNKDIEAYVAEMNATAEPFWDQKIEELKKEIFKKVCNQSQITEHQQEMIERYVTCCRKVDISYGALSIDSKMKEEEFQWVKQKGIDEKVVCKEYKAKLKANLEDKNKAVLKGSDKVSNKPEDILMEMLKEIKSDMQAVNEQLQRGLKECKEKKDKFIRLQEKISDSKTTIEALISF